MNEVVADFVQEVDTVADKCVVEENTDTLQEVSSVPGDFLTSFRVIPSKSLKNLVMVKTSTFVCDFDVRDLSPGTNYLVLVFIVADGDCVVDDVPDLTYKLVDEFEVFSLLFLDSLLLEFVVILEQDKFLAGVFLIGFLSVPDLFANIIPLFLDGVEIVSN